MSHIIIHDCTQQEYNPALFQEKPMGGIQGAVVNLSRALSARGYRVDIVNNTPESKIFYGAQWHNYKDPMPKITDPEHTFIIVNNDPNHFARYEEAIRAGARPLFWAHNTLNFKRFRKNSRWKAFMRIRPEAIFLSPSAKNSTPFYYPFSNTHIIPHFLNETVLELSATQPKNAPASLSPSPRVVFISHPHRGLDISIKAWIRYIYPTRPDAAFHVYCNEETALKILRKTKEELSAHNIHLMPRCTHAALMKQLVGAHALFYPGSKDETFCFAAAEASALGIPIISQGIGSLKDRVSDGENGLLSSSFEGFANNLLKTLNDDALWKHLRSGAFKHAELYKEDAVLKHWDGLFRHKEK